MSYVIDEVPDIFWFGGREYLKKSMKQKDRKLRCSLILSALLVATCDSFEEYEKIENMLISNDQLIKNGYALNSDLAIEMVDIIKTKIDDYDLKTLKEIIDTAITYYPISEKFWKMYSNYDVINLSKLTLSLTKSCSDEVLKIDPFTKMIIDKLKGKSYLNIKEFWQKFFSEDENDTVSNCMKFFWSEIGIELDDPESFWSSFYEAWIVEIFFEKAYFKRGKESFLYYGPFECLYDEEIYDMFVEKGFNGTQEEMKEMLDGNKEETEDFKRCYNEIYDEYYEEIKTDYNEKHYSSFWSWRWGEHRHTPRIYSYYVDSEGVEDEPDLDVVGRLSYFVDKNRLYDASNYKRYGEYDKSEFLYKRSLEYKKRTLGPDNPIIINILNELAEIYILKKEYAKAEAPYKRSLAIRERVLGPDHPDVATSLNSLADLYRTRGDYAKAELLYKRSLDIREKALGPDHPDVATNLSNLALLYYYLGDYVKAEPLFKRSLAIWEKALGPDHPKVATSLRNLASLYRATNRTAEAEKLEARAKNIQEIKR